jgi:hypothetical protein
VVAWLELGRDEQGSCFVSVRSVLLFVQRRELNGPPSDFLESLRFLECFVLHHCSLIDLAVLGEEDGGEGSSF